MRSAQCEDNDNRVKKEGEGSLINLGKVNMVSIFSASTPLPSSDSPSEQSKKRKLEENNSFGKAAKAKTTPSYPSSF